MKFILDLTDQEIQQMLRETDSCTLAIALIGIDEKIKEKILKNMSKRAGELLQEDIKFLSQKTDRELVILSNQNIISGTRWRLFKK